MAMIGNQESPSYYTIHSISRNTTSPTDGMRRLQRPFASLNQPVLGHALNLVYTMIIPKTSKLN